jgi:threonine/homoserine/homoserine lactone efflux protein
MSITFLLTSLVIVAMPGTGALLTISAGLARGARASFITAVGCTLGIVPHLIAAISGTAALLRASGLTFDAVRIAGVLYLLFMAYSTWRDHSPLVVPADETDRSAARMIGSAVLANLLNPKLTIFFFSFLPQFVPSYAGAQISRLLLLSATFMAMTLIVFVIYGAFATFAREHLLDRPRIIQRIRRAFAASFLALGVKLATTSR